MKKLVLSLLLTFASHADADTKENLARSIVDSGTHSFEDERNTIEISGCQMTTFRWRDRPGQGWVLWTSFRFDMVDAKIDEDSQFPGKKYIYGMLEAGPPEIGFSVVVFIMREGSLVRQERSVLHERSLLGEPSSATQPSPRGDGTSHYYEWRGGFIITMEGQGVELKAMTFTADYERYVKEYCTFAS